MDIFKSSREFLEESVKGIPGGITRMSSNRNLRNELEISSKEAPTEITRKNFLVQKRSQESWKNIWEISRRNSWSSFHKKSSCGRSLQKKLQGEFSSKTTRKYSNDISGEISNTKDKLLKESAWRTPRITFAGILIINYWRISQRKSQTIRV